MDTAGPDASVLLKMREDWDKRAQKNARHFIATGRKRWSNDEFYDSGRLAVFHMILNDLGNVCERKNPKDIRVLEIGCGAGRMTRALAEVFGEVYAVDVSGEMIALARKELADLGNVQLFQNNGADLEALGDTRIDFAFSYLVFQHIPSCEVIYSYVREVGRLLEPGGLFKFQVNGLPPSRKPPDTWLGVEFTDEQAVAMAAECGFEPRYRVGAGTQYFWLWFFKPQGGC
jgi:ubiquinone/menaquinone biosynthesis C-methylase UbiE